MPKEVMSPVDFYGQMREVAVDLKDDEAAAHRVMDNLMAELLTSLGYGAGVTYWRAQEKWYE